MKVIKIEIKGNSIYVTGLPKGKYINNDSCFYFNVKDVNNKNKELGNIINIKNINSVIYNDFESFMILCNALNIGNITFNVTKSLPNKLLDKLLTLSYVKYIECYFMPSDYVRLFSNKNVSIKFTNDMKFDKDFIFSNEFSNLKSIYYKKTIKFYTEEEIKNNFIPFLSFNNSVKLIHLYCYNKEIIDYIVTNLEKYKHYNVNIYIHQDESNAEAINKDIEHLKKVSKSYSKDSDRIIKIIYSNKYFSDKIFKQLTINGIKFTMVLLMYVSLIVIFSSKYHEYINYLNIRKLETDLEITIDEIDDTEETESVIITEEPTADNPDPEPVKVYVNKYSNIPTNYDSLLNINKDVVGWLKVNNTKINYPIVKGNNNGYYLNNDIYKNKATTGWVFMDYRNNSNELDKNTIIYGHNLKTGYMFGSLMNTLNYSWYKNKSNQIITFNTIEKEMKWQIFAIYKVEETIDYLSTSFYNDKQFIDFVNEAKEKSVYNFNVNVTSNDKILTLSTCSGKNRRLVVHAVLINE